MTLFLTLPYPINCTVNHLYIRTKKNVFVNKTAKNYKEIVYYLCLKEKKFEEKKVIVEIDLHPPDKRKRDLDNILKIVLDALEFAKIINNDCQITKLCVTKKEVVTNGCLKLKISEIKDDL